MKNNSNIDHLADAIVKLEAPSATLTRRRQWSPS